MLKTREALAGALAMAALACVGCANTDDDLGAEAQALDTAPLVARATRIDFGAVAVGATATRSVGLLNNSREVIDVTDVTFTSAFPPDPCRAVVLQPCIRPGESTALEVTCSPTAPGDFGGRVTLRYHHGSEFRSLTVSVSGQGAVSTR